MILYTCCTKQVGTHQRTEPTWGSGDGMGGRGGGGGGRAGVINLWFELKGLQKVGAERKL